MAEPFFATLLQTHFLEQYPLLPLSCLYRTAKKRPIFNISLLIFSYRGIEKRKCVKTGDAAGTCLNMSRRILLMSVSVVISRVSRLFLHEGVSAVYVVEDDDIAPCRDGDVRAVCDTRP